MADFTFTDGSVPSATSWNSTVRDQLIVICTSSTRPSAPATGRRIWETDTLKGYFYNGSAWVQIEDGSEYTAWATYTPSWTNTTTNPTLGNGALVGRYVLIGKTLIGSVQLSCGSTTTYGTGSFWGFTLPLSKTGFHTLMVGGGVCSDSSGGYWPVFNIYPGSSVYLYTAASSSDTHEQTVSSIYPFTWAVNDSLMFHFQCEVS